MDEKFLYAPFYNLERRDTGKLLESSPSGKMGVLESQNLVILQSENEKEAMEWLRKHEQAYKAYPIINVIGRGAVDAYREFAPQRKLCRSHHYVWTGKEAPKASAPMRFRASFPQDYKWIRARYDLIGDDELRPLVDNGDILIAFDMEENPVGFAGIHNEGSLGMLEVFEPYRRKGYACRIESTLIDFAMNRDLIPYGDVFADNAASIALQKELGLEQIPGDCFWSFEEE